MSQEYGNVDLGEDDGGRVVKAEELVREGDAKPKTEPQPRRGAYSPPLITD
jgi:hypothetical protein